MNILFLNNAEISPISNGIQRVTDVLVRGFSSYQNILCFSAYFNENNNTPKTQFHDKLLLVKGYEFELLSKFILKNKIDVVICQQLIINEKRFALIQQAIAQNIGCKSFYCLHACPDFAFVRPSLKADLFRLFHKKQVVKSCKKILVWLFPRPLYRGLVRRKVKKEYNLIQRYFDKTVLLSESYIKPYIDLCDNKDNCQDIAFINNPLSFVINRIVDIKTLQKKEKEVIIVSRLSDRQKRISYALKIWQEAKKNPIANEWKLTIIGSGEDEQYYKHLAHKLKLQDLHFDGVQDPSPYYQRASICLITSAYEGWAMNTVEALQTGTVPIAFNSYDALSDFLENNVNGITIPYPDVEECTKRLLWLMENKDKRQEIALKGQNTCLRFSVENIIKQWMALFNKSGIY